MEGVDPKEYVLELSKNVYGGKDAGRTWNKYLVNKLTQIGFIPSKADECVFYKGRVMYVLYTDDSILAGPDEAELSEVIKQMKGIGLDITEEGKVADFLGVHIERTDDTYHLSQPRLIDSILEELRLTSDGDRPSMLKDTPAASSKILSSRHPDSEPFDGHFHYKCLIGKLNYLEKSSQGELAYAVHQCARFCLDPKKEHGAAVKWIGRYLLGTQDKGYYIKNDLTRGLEVYSDADFAGAYDKDIAHLDSDTSKSRHGFVIMYGGAPILWQSQLQTETALIIN
jgi:hypothetical protein